MLKIRQIEDPTITIEPTTSNEWRAYIRNHNCKLLGRGASRIVYALDATRVIKLEADANNIWHMGACAGGMTQCQSEVRVWNNASPAKRSLLATIYSYGKDWIVMERAECTLDSINYEVAHKITTSLKNITKCNDLHGGNIGYFGKAKYKIIDYAL